MQWYLKTPVELITIIMNSLFGTPIHALANLLELFKSLRLSYDI